MDFLPVPRMWLDGRAGGGYTRRVMAKKPVVLIIRDGWGENPGGKKTAKKEGNATLLAQTPFHDDFLATCPSALLSDWKARVACGSNSCQ